MPAPADYGPGLDLAAWFPFLDAERRLVGVRARAQMQLTSDSTCNERIQSPYRQVTLQAEAVLRIRNVRPLVRLRLWGCVCEVRVNRTRPSGSVIALVASDAGRSPVRGETRDQTACTRRKRPPDANRRSPEITARPEWTYSGSAARTMAV
jgi:hypothetical protein